MKRTKIHIKPEELRIGNYVRISDKYVNTFSPIVGVTQQSVYIASGTQSYAVPLCEVQAIPLTCEILAVWCGFIFDTETPELKKGKIHIVFDNNDTTTVHFGSVSRCIKALHELQNIVYAITGEELSVTPDRQFVEKAPRSAWDLDAEMQKSIEKMKEIKSLRGEK